MPSLSAPVQHGDRLGDYCPPALVRTLADIALVVDADGSIVDLSLGSEALADELAGDWVGRSWLDTVSDENRPRLEALLRDADPRRPGDWCQVAHRTDQGKEIPFQYRALRVGPRGQVLAVGRELQAVAALQQQLVDAQQALERDYWRFRQMETRYRLLFQTVTEAVLIVDTGMRRVIEANPAALLVLGEKSGRVVGRPFPEGFAPEGARAIENLLGAVLSTGRPDGVIARRSGDEGEWLVSVSLLRQDDANLFLVRLAPRAADQLDASLSEAEAKLIGAVSAAPDAVLITDSEGRILAANRAFLDQVQLPNEQPVRGQSLERWLGRASIDLNVLLSTLRQHGTLRLFKTQLRGEYGASVEVEISAAAVANGERPCFGFFIRDVGRRLGSEAGGAGGLPAWIGQFTERVGSAPLRDLVRESTDVIERLCIEAALKLTGGNRASASELLGLSRQSLYVKLARYGIGGDAGEGE
jgi:transcriptional regulator PpsR